MLTCLSLLFLNLYGWSVWGWVAISCGVWPFNEAESSLIPNYRPCMLAPMDWLPQIWKCFDTVWKTVFAVFRHFWWEIALFSRILRVWRYLRPVGLSIDSEINIDHGEARFRWAFSFDVWIWNLDGESVISVKYCESNFESGLAHSQLSAFGIFSGQALYVFVWWSVFTLTLTFILENISSILNTS